MERERATWISEETQRLAYQRISLRQRHLVEQRELRKATRRFQVSLQEDRKWRVSTMGTYIEALIVAGQMR